MGRFSAFGAALCGVELRWAGSFVTVYAGAFARRDGRALCAWVFSGCGLLWRSALALARGATGEGAVRTGV